MSTSMFDEYDIFKTMHPVKLQVMKELAENMQGKRHERCGTAFDGGNDETEKS